MDKKSELKLYETFHKDKRLQKRIICDNNFTYIHLIKLFKPYLINVKTVLDIGSGVGTIDFYLANKGKKVTGIEISSSAVELAKINAKLLKIDKNITFITAAFPKGLPKTRKYDMVIFSEVIEHLNDDSQALKDIWKVLIPNGILIITTPSLNAPLYRLGLLNKFDKKVGHLRRYSSYGIKTLVETTGFKIIKLEKHEGILRNFLFTNQRAGKLLRYFKFKIPNFITWIDNLTMFIFGESNICLVAIKI